MSQFSSFYVDGLENNKLSQNFIRVILSYSDSFSFIYFRRKESEPLKKTAKNIKKVLSPFQINTCNAHEWPGTKLIGQQHQIYRMITYRASIETLPVFEKVDTLWDWDYPKYPMDPAFYKNGYAWFYICSHEHWNMLYLRESNNYPLVSDLESLGISLISKGPRLESDLFYHPNSIIK